jgi:hypothetical protein
MCIQIYSRNLMILKYHKWPWRDFFISKLCTKLFMDYSSTPKFIDPRMLKIVEFTRLQISLEINNSFRIIMALEGFEPTTPRLRVWCSDQAELQDLKFNRINWFKRLSNYSLLLCGCILCI